MALPARVGRYVVLSEIGRGAMGTVYRARDGALDRDVAVKVMSAGTADPEARARFEREARAAARLSHPNIVVVYELGEHAGAPFIALELLEGIDLQRAIEDGVRPDPRATLPLVLQVLAGLGHAHAHGIVHRDVKPSNVFLPLGRPAKVMDFGVARLAGHGTTTAGTIVGTPNYMSPEQVAGGEIDGRSDLFSAGLILYELVTGERAIAADTVVAAMYKIAHEGPDLAKIPAEHAWKGLRRVLERALARDLDERYPTAAAMADELAAALVALGGSPDLGVSSDHALLARRRPVTTEALRSGALPVERRAMPRPPALRSTAGVAPRRSRAWLLAIPIGLALAALSWVFRGSLGPAPAGVAPSSLPTANEAGPSAPVAAETAPPAPGLSPDAAAPETVTDPPAPPAALAPVAGPVTKPLAGTPASGPEATAGAAGRSPEERLARTRELLGRGRFVEALAEARSLLQEAPTNAEAASLAQQAEAELVVEDCLRKARAALRAGDRERALDEVRRGLFVRKNDPRLLELHREAVQQ